jgi:hypothetical protein
VILLCRCGLRWVAVAGESLPALCPTCRAKVGEHPLSRLVGGQEPQPAPPSREKHA